VEVLPVENGREVAYYVYAVARTRGHWEPGAPPDQAILPQAPIYTLAYQDLVALVSPVPVAEFGPPALEAHLEDAGWTRDRVVAHQTVLAALLTDYTLIPFKFCTLYRSEERVQAMLARHYEALECSLQRLAGATEWGVKLYYDRKTLTGWLASSAEVLQPLRETITRAPQGAGYFLRKKLAQAAQEAAEGMVAGWVQESHQRLADSAREAVVNPLQPPQVHGRADEMVLNGAYLVDDEAEETFRAVLAELADGSAARGLQYELTGPWPPYNFADLDLQEIPDE